MKVRTLLLGLLALAGLSLDAAAANNRALLIGISQYAELEGLKYADADVKTFSQILTEFGGYRRQDVAVVLNTEATKRRIMDEISKVVRESKRQPLDHFILMFAGHGMPGQIEAGRAGSAGAVETNIFLAPSDASPGLRKVVQRATRYCSAWIRSNTSSTALKPISMKWPILAPAENSTVRPIMAIRMAIAHRSRNASSFVLMIGLSMYCRNVFSPVWMCTVAVIPGMIARGWPCRSGIVLEVRTRTR